MPAVELAVVAAALAPLLAARPVRRAVAALPRSYAVAAGGLAAAVVAGHLAGDPRGTFPFAPWTMYGGPAPAGRPVEWFEVRGVAGGAEVQINPSRLYPTLARGTFRMASLEHDTFAPAAAPGATPEQTAAAAALLRAVAAAHARRTGDPVTGVRLYRHRRAVGGPTVATDLVLAAGLP